MRILTIYGTVEGQTRKIADHVSEQLKNAGHTVDLVDAVSPPEKIAIDEIDAVIALAPVHAGHFPMPFRRFVRAHSSELMARPGLFVSVSLAAAGDDRDELADLDTIAAAFSKECDWWPVVTHHAAGALKYTQYDFFRKWMLKRISASHDGPVDTSRDFEFTDWAALDEAVAGFVGDAHQMAGKI